MKKIIILSILLSIMKIGNSQVLISLLLGDKLNSEKLEFGLETGINWSKISNLEANKFSRKFNIGFYFDMTIKNQWNFYTGVLVKANQGVEDLSTNDLTKLEASIYSVEGDYSQKIESFIVPALLKYKFKNYFYLEAGPQFSLSYNSWIEYNSKEEDIETTKKENNKNEINKFDTGIQFGFGYKLLKGQGWTLGVKYYQGLLNVYKEGHHKNSSIFVKLNVPIGAGKKKA